MKNHIYCLSFFVAVLVFQVSADDQKKNEWGVATNGVQMAINLKGGGKQAETNKQVKLLIHLKNVSTNEVFILNQPIQIETDDSYSFDVILPSDHHVSSTPEFMPGSGGICKFAPSQILEFKYDLSQRCKFSEIGDYKITAKKVMWGGNPAKRFVVISNPLSVSVVSDK